MGYYDRNVIHDQAAISSFTNRVYGWMSLGLGATAVVAYFVYATGLYASLMPFWWVLGIATFGIAMWINAGIQRISIQAAMSLFLVYAGLQGIFFGTLLPAFAAAYGGGVIWTAFATSAGIFALAVAYGIFTKSDLTSLGRILTLAVIGLVAVTLIYFVLSFFFNMTWATLLISYLGLAIFVGLTAYDAQTIRRYARQVGASSPESYKLSIIMAMSMYINVIMIFWYLLQIFSSNSRR